MIEVWTKTRRWRSPGGWRSGPTARFTPTSELKTNTCGETAGVYDRLSKPDSDTFVIIDKKQVAYTFEKIGTVDSLYMLTSGGGQKRQPADSILRSAERPAPNRRSDRTRRQKAGLRIPSGNQSGEKIIDPIYREIEFAYTDGLLASFTDAEDQQTAHEYFTTAGEGSCSNPSSFPKGNVITNEYQQRKLTSTRIDNQSPVEVEFKPQYASGSYETVAQTYKNGQPDISVSRTYDLDATLTDYQVKIKTARSSQRRPSNIATTTAVPKTGTFPREYTTTA